jgi:hypothetical protein
VIYNLEIHIYTPNKKERKEDYGRQPQSEDSLFVLNSNLKPFIFSGVITFVKLIQRLRGSIFDPFFLLIVNQWLAIAQVLFSFH